MFYTNSENVPQTVHTALDTMGDCQGMKVPDMLSKSIRNLDKATAGSRHNPVDLEGGDPMMIDSDDGKSSLVYRHVSCFSPVTAHHKIQNNPTTEMITTVMPMDGHQNLPSAIRPSRRTLGLAVLQRSLPQMQGFVRIFVRPKLLASV